MPLTKKICEQCGQPLLKRHGVYLPPKLAELFDLIERAGPRGLTPNVLASIFYPDKDGAAARNCLKANISHINDRFAETDVCVLMSEPRYGAYRVVTMPQEPAA